MKDYKVIHATFRKSGAEEAMVNYSHLNPILWYTPHSGWEVRIYES
jgi:hypothetical protein